MSLPTKHNLAIAELRKRIVDGFTIEPDEKAQPRLTIRAPEHANPWRRGLDVIGLGCFEEWQEFRFTPDYWTATNARASGIEDAGERALLITFFEVIHTHSIDARKHLIYEELMWAIDGHSHYGAVVVLGTNLGASIYMGDPALCTSMFCRNFDRNDRAKATA